MEWTSVNDGLPKGRNKWNSCWWMVKPRGKIPTTDLFIDEKWVSEKNVTHWGHLPESPKDNE